MDDSYEEKRHYMREHLICDASQQELICVDCCMVTNKVETCQLNRWGQVEVRGKHLVLR